MLRLFYNVVFPILFLVSWPWFAWRMFKRGRFRQGFGERFSCYSPELLERLQKLKNPIWIHAVSVGEMMLARVLISEIRRLRSEQEVVITCTTSTARALGERELADNQTVILYSPADFLPVVGKAFRLIRPGMILLIEQELWPNQLWKAERQKVPVWIINARLSDRSWSRFRKFRRLLAPLLAKVSLVGLQSEGDRERFLDAGFPAHTLFTTGSMKYDVADLAKADQGIAEKFLLDTGWSKGNQIFLAGSTHPGEEEILLEVYLKLLEKHPGLKFLLAPRHAERGRELLNFVRSKGRKVSLRNKPEKDSDIVILNTTGELRSLYELATVVFIGKTWCSPEGKGGQNFLEASRVGVPVVVGPKVENFQALVEEHVKAGALIQVENRGRLDSTLDDLFSDEMKRRAYGDKARQLFESNLGIGHRVALMIESYLKKT